MMNVKNLTPVAGAFFLVLLLIQPTFADLMTVELFNQDFESDTTGWVDNGGGITQVSSGGGTLGVASSGGGGHAEVTTAGGGTFTRFGAYRYNWTGAIIQKLDIYIDPNAGSIGDGWFLDNAVNDNLNNNAGISAVASDWREAGGVGALKATNGNWWITADADGAAYQGPPEGGVGLEITSAGWYTITSEWVANDDGLTVDRNTYIHDSSGTELYSNLNPAQVAIGGAFPIGGNRYGWLNSTSGSGPITLAIDNSTLAVAVPEPTAFSLFAVVGTCAMITRRRRFRSAVN